MIGVIPNLEDQTYLCHPGNQGVSCAFHLDAPSRAKIIPYSYLLCIDLLGDRMITLRYSFIDVELSIGRDFPGRIQFIDDFANFRVSTVRESRLVKMRIISEPNSEKSEIF
jgi:hypothetical protein